MRWIQDYQLFLFDLDGLLVNTEEIHYLAYKTACEGRGIAFPWTFYHYCHAAHEGSEHLQRTMAAELEGFVEKVPAWDPFYEEKKRALKDLLRQDAIHLMPGVEELLKALDEAQITSCVVTHSALEQVEIIREKNPLLSTIAHWITREHYSHAKPHPEGYLMAIDRFSESGDKAIGFEDTPRGLRALLQTPAKPVWISQVEYPGGEDYLAQGVVRYPDFTAIPDEKLG